jgi:hypothetical protein
VTTFGSNLGFSRHLLKHENGEGSLQLELHLRFEGPNEGCAGHEDDPFEILNIVPVQIAPNVDP